MRRAVSGAGPGPWGLALRVLPDDPALHLGVLLVDPWIVTVGSDVGVPLDEPVDLQVANPLCFMVQKFLILNDRAKKKRHQDLLYVHDTLLLFGHMLPQLKITWGATVKPQL